ncbi:hypothetical protein FKM82_029384 [Ascaphus truei]
MVLLNVQGEGYRTGGRCRDIYIGIYGKRDLWETFYVFMFTSYASTIPLHRLSYYYLVSSLLSVILKLGYPENLTCLGMGGDRV